MARPAGFSSIGAVLVLTSVLVVMGFDRGDAEPGHGGVGPAATASEQDTGLAGDPEDPRVDTKTYIDGLAWKHSPGYYFPKFKAHQEQDYDCDKSTPAKKVKLLIEPEKRVHRLAVQDFAKRGRFVARITNKDDTLTCGDWHLPRKDAQAFVWMGPGTGSDSVEVRIYSEDSSGAYVKRVRGAFEQCTDAKHDKPRARWRKKDCAQPGVRHAPFTGHNVTWISCSGGCCSAKSLGP